MNTPCCVQELQGQKEGVSIATAVQHLPADDIWLADIQQQVYPGSRQNISGERGIGLENLSKALHTAAMLAASGGSHFSHVKDRLTKPWSGYGTVFISFKLLGGK